MFRMMAFRIVSFRIMISTTMVIDLSNSIYPRYDVVRMALDLCGLPYKNSSFQSNHEKNIKKFSNKGYCTKYLTSTL
jgi:hypothetical protein